MPIVDRPNKEALLKALDIFLDKMRPFFVERLHFAPGETVRSVLEHSLRGDQSVIFSRNLHFRNDLESAIEVSFIETLTEAYWDDIFARPFGGDRKVIRKFRKITEARNRASHPPHLCDLDDQFTQGSLCLIAHLLRRIRASEEHAAVVRLRDGLGIPARPASEAETVNTRELEKKVQEADAARLAAEKRARILEAYTTKAHERSQIAERSRVHAEKESNASDAARQRAEKLAQSSESARQESERCALAAGAAQLRAEKELQATIEILREKEQRLKETEATLRRIKKREANYEASFVTRGDVVRPIHCDRPPARNTPQSEDWLIGELLSGKISRSMLCRYAGDRRVDGRLVHYVHAASSSMSQKAWTKYVANRRETLARGRNTRASIPRA